MARTRSPNYPSMDLSEALEAVRKVFQAENRNKFSRLVLAQNLGYSSLNGRALAKIGAVRAYGLVEGAADDLRLSEDAITALMAPSESPERHNALERTALKPALFAELRKEFQGVPSENNLRFWLIKRHYTPEAAGKAAQTYLATMRLVGGDNGEYVTPPKEEFPDMQTSTESKAPSALGWTRSAASGSPRGVLQEVFNLEEGPVTLSFPAALSEESFQDLSDHLELFLRKAKRRALAAKGGGHEDN
jgi:hypothetical protein